MTDTPSNDKPSKGKKSKEKAPADKAPETEPIEVEPEPQRRAMWSGLVGLVSSAFALVLLAVGSRDVAEERGLDGWSALLLAAGFCLIVVGLTLLQGAFRLRDQNNESDTGKKRKTPPKDVPWLSLGAASLVVGAFVTVTCLALADAFVERKPSRVVSCPSNSVLVDEDPDAERNPAVFTFPDEAEQTAGLKVQMGRSRPASARSDQILVYESGDPPGADVTVAEDQEGQEVPAEDVEESGDVDPDADVEPGEYLQVALSELRRDDGARLNRQLVTGWARMLNDRNLEVAICFTPLSDQFAETDPGRYTGRLTVIDPRLARMEIPVEIQMQFDRWPILLVLLIGTLIVAAFTLFNGVKQLSGQTASLKTSTLKDFRDWITTNPVAIGTGVVAAVALFGTQYLADPAWSGRTYEVFALIGATAASFLGAATVAAGLDPTRKGKNGEDEEPDQPGDEDPPADRQPTIKGEAAPGQT